MYRLSRQIAACTGLLLTACTDAPQAPEPSTLPDRVILTWSGDPARSQSVTWRTSAEIAEGKGQITRALGEPDLGAEAVVVQARTESLRLRDSEWNRGAPASVSYHSLTFTDLEPATLYAYRVGQGDAWSEWHHFRTASDEISAPFRFLYFGDAQNGVLSHWARALRTAYSMAPDAAFAIHAGDLVNDGHADAQWSEWHRAGGWLHATLPSIPVTGNHEYRSLDKARAGEQQLSMLWRPQFSLPQPPDVPDDLSETVFWLDYQGARVFVLNSNRSAEQQALWLDEALTATDEQGAPERWKIVTFHHPLFSNAVSRDSPELRALWLPVLRRHDVDLVLQGHDHTYSRGTTDAQQDGSLTRPPDADGAGPGRPVGTVFIVSVAGSKQYELAAEPWSMYEGAQLQRAGENTQFFQIIDVGAERLGYRAYTAAGEIYDGFELVRTEAGGKRLIDLEIVGSERRFGNTGPYRSDHWSAVP